MPKLIDLIGQKFGRWTVLERVFPNKGSHAAWDCECICGQIITVSSSDLRSGHSQSCGCLQKEMTSMRLAGKKNHRWSGNDVKYRAAHEWLTKHKPRPALCEGCRARPPCDLSYNKGKGWSRNIDDYIWLCRSCHMQKDLGISEFRPLTRARIHRIREFFKCGIVQRELANLFSVSQNIISKIVNRYGIFADFNLQCRRS